MKISKNSILSIDDKKLDKITLNELIDIYSGEIRRLKKQMDSCETSNSETSKQYYNLLNSYATLLTKTDDTLDNQDDAQPFEVKFI